MQPMYYLWVRYDDHGARWARVRGLRGSYTWMPSPPNVGWEERCKCIVHTLRSAPTVYVAVLRGTILRTGGAMRGAPGLAWEQVLDVKGAGVDVCVQLLCLM